MLADIDHLIEPINRVIANHPVESLLFERGISAIRPGVYDGRFNLGALLQAYTSARLCSTVHEDRARAAWDAHRARREAGEDLPPFDFSAFKEDYGVADGIEQILDYYAEEVADPDTAYIIGATILLREDEPEHGGRRWHKLGPYIGTQSPQCEYLAHEPEIEQVVAFTLHRLDGVTERGAPC